MDILEDFHSIKTKTLVILKELTTVTHNNALMPSASDSIMKTISSIESDKFLVAVVGVIKRGKSTLLNALLKAENDILSINVTPETARLSFLNYSDEPSANIFTLDNKQIKIPISELPEYTSSFDTVNPKGVKEKVENTLYAEIFYPNDLLKKGFCIIDTPGVEDPDEKRSMVTLNFIGLADAVVFLMAANEGGLKDSELKFLQSKILNNHGTSKGIILACNRISSLRPRQLQNELPKLIENNEKFINRTFGTDLKIFPIDTLDALKGIRENNPDLYERSRFEPFKEHLENYLVKEKGKLFLRNRITTFIIEDIEPLIKYLQTIIKEEPLNLTEIEGKLKKSEKDIQLLERKTENIFNKYNNEKESIETWIKTEVIRDFNDNISISPDAIHNLPKDINRITEQITKIVLNKTKIFFDGLIKDFKLEDIRISPPNFNIKIKNIQTANYFSVENITIQGSNDGRSVGKVLGGLLGFIFGGGLASMPLAAAGYYLGDVIGSLFDTNDSIKSKTKFDEMGLKKEIDKTKKELLASLVNELNYYFEDVSKSVAKNLEQKRRDVLAVYNTQKQVLTNEIFNYESFVFEVNTKIDQITSKKNKLIEILKEVEKL